MENETRFIVRFREHGVWINLTEIPVSEEEARELFDRHTYNSMLFVEPKEEIFFQIREVSFNPSLPHLFLDN
jgi:hypothetical protein